MTNHALEEEDRLMTPAEVAGLFRVDPKTVTRWAGSGRLASLFTPGGHRRFRESVVRQALSGKATYEDDEDLAQLIPRQASGAGKSE